MLLFNQSNANYTRTGVIPSSATELQSGGTYSNSDWFSKMGTHSFVTSMSISTTPGLGYEDWQVRN